MERQERFKMAFTYLKGKGLIHKQKDVAEKMGSTEPNVSAALKGVDKVLTDKFLNRFNEAFGSVFNNDWLLWGNGDMLKPTVFQNNENGDNIQGHSVTVNKTEKDYLEIIKNQSEQISKSQEQIDKLLSIITKLSDK